MEILESSSPNILHVWLFVDEDISLISILKQIHAPGSNIEFLSFDFLLPSLVPITS